MIYIVDTETNGLPAYFYPKHQHFKDWPEMVSIAYRQETEGVDSKTVEHIIQAQNFLISPSSTAIHGITQEKSMTEGIEIKKALKTFLEVLMKDDDPILCAYNMEFDKGILLSECYRNNLIKEAEYLSGPAVQWVCLMKRAHGVLKRKRYHKFLKLKECVDEMKATKLVSENLNHLLEFHTASGDVAAAALVLRGIVALEQANS